MEIQDDEVRRGVGHDLSKEKLGHYCSPPDAATRRRLVENKLSI